MPNDLQRQLQQIPGIGPKLARRIISGLDIEDTETLRVAVESGRVEEVPGVGAVTAQWLREGLTTDPAEKEPPVDTLLDVDEQYRAQARAGELPMIAPKRNNPSGEAWLPLLKTKRDRRHFTALFSNTDQAHELGKTDDWVVIYEDVPDEEGDYEDWVELYNRGGEPAYLGNLTLTDDLDRPGRWALPDVMLDPGGLLLLWLDDDVEEGPLHAPFKLDADGEALGLFDASGYVLDTLRFGEQTTDVSAGRYPDGTSAPRVLSAATPGATNAVPTSAKVPTHQDAPSSPVAFPVR